MSKSVKTKKTLQSTLDEKGKKTTLQAQIKENQIKMNITNRP